MSRTLWVGLIFLFFPHFAWSEIPPSPSIIRDLSLVQAGKFTRPYIPPLRLTNDGRIGLNQKPGPNGYELYLLSPEGMSPSGAAFVNSPAGVYALADKFVIPRKALFLPSQAGAGSYPWHSAICDGSAGAFPKMTEVANPLRCGTDKKSDCYTFKIVTAVQFNSRSQVQLWSTVVKVQVDSPKSPRAKLGSVTTEAPVKGKEYVLSEFFEPTLTADGKLLVGRIERHPLSLSDTTSKYAQSSGVLYDIVYSYNPIGVCDVSGWTKLYPVSRMPFDPELKNKYGIARNPFRDTEGNPIADGVDIRGTYPWIDLEGNNLFFFTISSSLYDRQTKQPRYPETCAANPGCPPPTTDSQMAEIDEASPTRGLSFLGAWTHGKMVQFDSIINNSDYGVRLADSKHRLLNLYSGTSPIRIGMGRDNSDLSKDPASDFPEGYVFNTTFLGSFQNRFNFIPTIAPVTKKDLVWLMNAGKASAEIAFDEYISLNTLIFSDMTGSLELQSAGLIHHDGYVAGAGFTEKPHLQNAATSPGGDLHLKVPRFGEILGSPANGPSRTRIEPVALGGIHGKGIWLDGLSGLRYSIPPQSSGVMSRPENRIWYAGVFIDRRANQERQRVFTFPDSSRIELSPSKVSLFSDSNRLIGEISVHLPFGTWSHLGFVIDQKTWGSPNEKTLVKVYFNGLPIGSVTYQGISFRVVGEERGSFILGVPKAVRFSGIKGWVDELKVVAGENNPEMLCNHARGTLIGTNDSSNGAIPGEGSEISQYLSDHQKETFRYYVCYRPWNLDSGATINPPVGTTALRSAINTPEEKLRWNQPRPDFTQNTFCLSCHTSQEQGGLTLRALQPGVVWMKDDPRRAPSQPLRLGFGNYPTSLQAPAEISPGPIPDSYYLDQWTSP